MRPLSLTFVAGTAIFATLASAQTPVGVTCMAYANLDEKTLYIQGGIGFKSNARYQTSSFFALDLTVSTWPTSNPPWLWPPMLLNTNGPNSSCHSMVVDKDRENMFIWDPYQKNAWWTYNIVVKYWSNYTMPLPNTQQAGIRNGVDLNTGNVYIPAGSSNGTKMVMNVPGSSATPVTDMPTSLMPIPIIQESFVWSTYRNSFLHYGGKSIDGKTANPHLNEFSSTYSWAAVTTTGSSPGDVSGHCMVPAYDGTKMIVFGGAGLDGVAKGDIYVLDVPTRIWAVGKPADVSQARTNMACSVSGDSFIAWGGESASGIKDATPIVFDMKNNVWTTVFNRVITATVTSGPASTTPGTPPPTPTTNSPVISPQQSPTTNTAVIGGGIAGVVVVIALIGFVFYRRRHRHTRSTGNSKDDDAIGLSPREPREPEGHFPKTEPAPPKSPSPLRLRPRFDNYDFTGVHAAAGLPSYQYPTSPSLSIGPYAALRSPEIGNAYVPTSPYMAEWAGDNDLGPPHDVSTNSSNNDVYGSGNNGHHKFPLSPHNPQTLSGGEEFRPSLRSGDPRPRGPQGQQQQAPAPSRRDRSQSNNNSSHYVVDQSQYQDRSKELVRMMDSIRAEQEELERARLEHEALMQNYRRGDSHSQSYYQPPLPPK
ncbi:Leucine-zipper-like transcriptional regulator 1 [Linnemannia hyalina]|uniref:Leucine-zipper-like transcriptional regulator 1 n=1 Tax=Linnemannia hyalina TaxID=64524 RepID=A0A9P7XJ08_9FUNG|nr:Leucine-zipper-like transcriptional regulator 1 [Linnemannia hyalina]